MAEIIFFRSKWNKIFHGVRSKPKTTSLSQQKETTSFQPQSKQKNPCRSQCRLDPFRKKYCSTGKGKYQQRRKVMSQHLEPPTMKIWMTANKKIRTGIDKKKLIICQIWCHGVAKKTCHEDIKYHGNLPDKTKVGRMTSSQKLCMYVWRAEN